MSAQLRRQREAYYAGLEATQKGTFDITERLEWFLDCLNSAFDGVEETLSAVFRKVSFWQSCAATPLNERQKMMVNKLLDDFEGKLTSSKWAKLAKRSQDTAPRDIQDLVKARPSGKGPRWWPQH
jgi:Fic family protein